MAEAREGRARAGSAGPAFCLGATLLRQPQQPPSTVGGTGTWVVCQEGGCVSKEMDPGKWDPESQLQLSGTSVPGL